MFNWRIMRPLMIVIVISLVAAACQPAVVEPPAPTEKAPEPAVEEPVEEVVEEPAEEVVEEPAEEVVEEPAEEAPPEEGRFAGKKVVVVTQTGRSIGGPVEDYAPEWEAMTGGEVELQQFAFGELFEKIITSFETGAADYDVLIFPADWAGDFMAPGYLVPIPQAVLDGIDPDDIIPLYGDRITAWGDTVYALPYDGDAHMLYYRKDLVAPDSPYAADFEAEYGYPLDEPVTWSQYYDIAAFFNGREVETAGATAPIYGVAEAQRRNAQSYWVFLSHAAGYGKVPGNPCFFFSCDDTMTPQVNNPGWVQALQDYIKSRDLGPPEQLQWDVADTRVQFPAGVSVLNIDWGDVGPISYNPDASVIIGDTGFGVLPGGDRYWDYEKGEWVEETNIAPFIAFGGWIIGVPVDSEVKDAALNFAAFMAQPEMVQHLAVTADTGINPSRFSQFEDLDMWVDAGFDPEGAQDYLDAVLNTINDPNAVLDLRIRGSAEYLSVLDVEVSRALAEEISPQEALDNVAAGWDEITDRLGREGQLEQYRSAVGFSGEAVAPAEEEPSSFEGKKVVVVTQTGRSIGGPVEDYAPEWEAMTGGEVELQQFAFGELFEKIITSFETGAADYDVLIFPADWAGDFMAPGYLVPIPQAVLDGIDPDDIIPLYGDRITAWGDTVYALPYDGDAHMLYYRKDLVAPDSPYAADFEAEYGYPLDEPVTWSQYYDIAAFFNGREVETAGATAPIYGVAEAQRRNAQSYWVFLSHAAGYGKVPGNPCFFFSCDDTMTPQVNNPGWVQALQDYIKSRDLGPPEQLQWDVADTRVQFPAGVSVLNIDWGDVGPISYNPDASVIIGDTGFGVLPGGDRYWDYEKGEWVEETNIAPFIAFGGWIIGVPVDSEVKDAALNFAAFMAQPEMVQHLAVTADTGINPSRFSQFEDLDMWVDAGFDPEGAQDYLDAVLNTINDPNAVLDLRIRGSAEYLSVLDVEVSRALAEEISPQEALDNVAAGWDEITDRLGREGQLEQYRSAVGFSGE